MAEQKHILHIAAENDALPGGKVGGIGDVVRDIAPALAESGCRVTVVMPSHGYLHKLPGLEHRGQIGFFFWGSYQVADLYEAPAYAPHPLVRQFVVHHPILEYYDPGLDRYRIYVNDNEPFSTDASRFACFGAIVATAATQGTFGDLDAIHLHDWHAAFVAFLRRFDPFCQPLRAIRTVYTIHNLAMQGIRPLRDHRSSLEAWFPGLWYDWLEVSDPHLPSCCNVMAIGIRLSDRVHVVSPSYAEEICRPDNKPHAYGAEGLEMVTRYVHDQGQLTGILNGCIYPEARQPPRPAFADLIQDLKNEVLTWTGAHVHVPTPHYMAVQRLSDLQRRSDPPDTIMTSISRAVDQKMEIMRARTEEGTSALERIMQTIDPGICYLVLASGDESYHRFLTLVSARYPNFVFLNGYSDHCADLLYANGDLFLMPSSFEPCGISQMLAMRDSQPCVAHAVGGLKDTIRHEDNGFLFNGRTLMQQADNFTATVRAALDMKRTYPDAWQKIRRSAAESRFLWADTARQYMADLYGFL